MFKRGEILTYDDGSGLFVWTGNRKYKDLSDNDVMDVDEDCPLIPYTGPVYEKDGHRYVPSGEFRGIKHGEWYLNELHAHDAVSQWTMNDSQNICVPILLPVPDLEPECEFEAGDWVRHKYVRDYLRLENTSTKPDYLAVTSNGVRTQVNPMNIEKLPGRPLTTDDLMQVLSGKKIKVECHACQCGRDGGVAGEIFTFKCDVDPEDCANSNILNFFHTDQPVSFKDDPLAWFKKGKIVFADGVENNIFVIE